MSHDVFWDVGPERRPWAFHRMAFGSKDWNQRQWGEICDAWYQTRRGSCPRCKAEIKFYEFDVLEGTHIVYQVAVFCDECGAKGRIAQCVDPLYKKFRQWTDEESLALVKHFWGKGWALCPICQTPVDCREDARLWCRRCDVVDTLDD